MRGVSNKHCLLTFHLVLPYPREGGYLFFFFWGGGGGGGVDPLSFGVNIGMNILVFSLASRF